MKIKIKEDLTTNPEAYIGKEVWAEQGEIATVRKPHFEFMGLIREVIDHESVDIITAKKEGGYRWR